MKNFFRGQKYACIYRLNTKIRLTMLCLSGFELHSRCGAPCFFLVRRAKHANPYNPENPCKSHYCNPKYRTYTHIIAPRFSLVPFLSTLNNIYCFALYITLNSSMYASTLNK